MPDYPHLCIISQEIPHLKAAGAILLFRLLESWPSERLTVYGPPPPAGAGILRCAYHQFRPATEKLHYSRFAPLAPPLSWILPIGEPACSLPRNSVVLSVMQSSAYYRSAWAVARRNEVPLALIIHDDPEEIEPVKWWSRGMLRHFNARTFRAAKVRFCISPQMCASLEARYGAKSALLYPNRSRKIIARRKDLNFALRRKSGLVIGYAGTLAYGYGQRLEQLLPMLRRHGVILRIYSRQRPWFVADGVEYAGGEPDHVWPRVQADCDAVILPYAGPEHGHATLYETHFPSKLPEYLALGMPVIITGPAYATGVQWGLGHPDACIVVANEAPETWRPVLARLSTQAHYRCELAENARAAANGEFDPDQIETFFTTTLRGLTVYPEAA